MPDVVSDQTEISYAESVTGWSGDTFVIDNELFVQGSNAVNCNQTSNGANDVIFSGTWNMSGKHIRLYASTNITPNMDPVDALQVILGDGSTTATWTVEQKASYKGGWQDFFFDVDSTPDIGSVNSAAITSVTFRINTATKPRNSVNGWYDNWRFGNGLTCNSTASEAISFGDIASEDNLSANKYGILVNTDEVLFAKGELILGDAGSKNCNLVSSNEQIVFIDRVVAATLYKIKTQESTGTTDIDISGLVCKTVGSSGAELDISSTLNSLSLVSSNFIGMGNITITPTVTSPSIVANIFTSCGATTTSETLTTCSFNDCGPISLTGSGTLASCNVNTPNLIANEAAVSTPSLASITDTSFSRGVNGHAIELTSIGGGTMSMAATATGYAAGATGSPVTTTAVGDEAIYVSATSGTVTINVEDGATTPSIRSAGAIVNVVAGLVTLTIEAPNGSEVRIRQGSYTIQHTQVISGGNTTYTYTFSAGTKVTISAGGSGLIRQSRNYTLLSGNATVTFDLEPDPSYI